MSHNVQVIPLFPSDFYRAVCIEMGCKFQSVSVSKEAAEAFATAHRNGETHSLFIEKANEVFTVTCMCGWFRERSAQRAAELIGGVHLKVSAASGSMGFVTEQREAPPFPGNPDPITLDIRYKAATLTMSRGITSQYDFRDSLALFEKYLRTGVFDVGYEG